MATRAPPAGLPAKVVPIPPNQTLYVTNLPSNKIQKSDLRMGLYMLFSTYGAVLDVVALKTTRMRGQAHVTFRDIQTATQAMRTLDGFEFLGHEMKIAYAKTKSRKIAQLDGTFKLPSMTSAAQVEVTDLQHSIFNAPVPGSAAPQASHGLPAKPSAAPDHVMKDAGTPESRGTKRVRDEEEDEESDSDVAMEEDSDDDD